MRTNEQIRASWNKAKHAQVANGYATEYDRRTAQEIRARQRDGVPVTTQQTRFAAHIEAIAGCSE